ncbi:MAG: M23 family metallopeptidase [Roseburia sp.]|nr:M23 family metallopeptidase [Roseburia sp.]
MNRRNGKRPAMQKEKMSVIAASVFVLSALTLAGVYMAAQDDTNTEENRIDFAKLEEQQNTATEEKEDGVTDTRFVSGKADVGSAPVDERFVRPDEINDLSNNNDMDVDPEYTEVSSGQVTNTPVELAAEPEVQTDEPVVLTQEAVSEEPAVSLSFGEGDSLQLPIVGKVIMNYSMDKAVYHGTMQQYRYNPALIVAATEGDIITAAAEGIVTDIYRDAQTGNTIVFDLGSGYALTYGQLEDITLSVGDRVSAGDMVGKVAKPTIYYTEEGANVYFKLTKDGVPLNPLDKIQ